MRRVRLVFQYDGTDYHGFQRQPALLTIQGELELALNRVLGEEVVVTGAGRTDAGVHALGQVAAFDTTNPMPVGNLLRALNDALPDAIKLVSAEQVSAEFHPRYDAKGKVYKYRILNRELPSPFINRYAWHVPEPLDVPMMRAAAEKLVGTHDFAAFCASGSSVEKTVRTVRCADLEPEGDLLELRFEADGFLYMMVRIMVGTLVEVGLGRLSPEEVGRALDSRKRSHSGPTAPPQGLSLVKVIY